MIKSMTGFGRYEFASAERKITVEMKSVNHRYSEISVRMPKKLNMFEAGIRNVLKQYISRGKVDMFITYEDESEGKACVRSDNDADLNALGLYLSKYRTVEKIEVLPYHTLGAFKYEKMGISYSLEGVAPLSDEALSRAKKVLGKYKKCD